MAKALTMDEEILSLLTSEQKQLTALWYAKMSGEVAWINDGERGNFEREFTRLEKEIRVQMWILSPHGYVKEGDEGLERLLAEV